jgi:hypothetical protein
MSGYNKNSAHENKEASSNFKRIKIPNKSDLAECKHCGKTRAWNVTQFQAKHLLECSPYLQFKRTTQAQSQSSLKKHFKSEEMDLKELYALAIFTSTANFSQHDTPEWKQFFKRIKFEPPNRRELVSKYLPLHYERIKHTVSKLAANCKSIQIISDGSANIAKTRVENISFMLGDISFYWQSTAIGAIKAGADWTVKHVWDAAKVITSNCLPKFTVFSSDTCSTQRSTWTKLHEVQDLAHVHSVPCNSHGLQLVMSDLLWPKLDANDVPITTQIGIFFANGPNKIYSFFSGAHKQLAILRGCMRDAWQGRTRALIATVPTRWGTQVDQLDSIIRAEAPLRLFSITANAADTINPLLQDNMFWDRTIAAKKILGPIHEQQKMSESNRATLAKVYPCWMTINSHLMAMSSPGACLFSQDIAEYLARVGKGGWNYRMSKQLLPVHTAAYILTPVHGDAQLLPFHQTAVDVYITERLGVEGFHQFRDYLSKEGEFNPTRQCWTAFKDHTKDFWRSIVCLQSFKLMSLFYANYKYSE